MDPTPSASATELPDAALPFEPTREVRFAVVMYGGVSLAIYINGIAQELLHMVRATAADPKKGTRTLTPVEEVYREAARIANARFVVDILSGTSAGGINAIYLAKALANDQPLTQLKQLWITEGDIAKLINDATSVQGTGLTRPAAPEALLNGQRMYQKLLEAFDGMDGTAPAEGDRTNASSPLVEELDLFVTATDINGVPLPIRLSDGIVVQERKHRGVFHFRRGDVGYPNHFSRAFNPFLAFAARCTSAFPFAFEPMRLKDIDHVLDVVDGHRGGLAGRAGDAAWTEFMDPFRAPDRADWRPEETSFGDGGYLDNKPFSYAAEALLRREAGVPMERKLVYIEPKPEHPERDRAPSGRPDAIENVLAATVGLPRYETMREDLERLLERNRLTRRVRTLTRAVEADLTAGMPRQTIDDAEKWGKRHIESMVQEHGVAYGAYHRLRVAATTDWLATVVGSARGVEEGSDWVLAIRDLVGAWRDQRYSLREPPDERLSENRFLLDFDLDFRIRRLRYVLGKATWLHSLDREAEEALRQIAAPPPGKTSKARSPVAQFAERPMTEGERAAFREELVKLKGELLPGYSELRKEEEVLTRRSEHPLQVQAAEIGIQPEQLREYLELPSERREREAHLIVLEGGRDSRLYKFAEALRGRLLDARRTSSQAVDVNLHPHHASLPAEAARRLARKALWHYYNHYADYDMVSFPVLYSTGAGEQETVAVVRISPEDATFVFDENKDARGRRKLAGTFLFNFGGFLQDTWRVNDMLWGRLDGAERIICTVLPGAEHKTQRDDLLRRVTLAILKEEFQQASRTEISGLMAEALVAVGAGRSPQSAVSRVRATIEEEQVPSRLDAAFHTCLEEEEEILAYFRTAYEVDRTLDRRTALEAMARSSRVVGRMLEGISARRSLEGTGVRWVTRAGSWFWGLVQVAVPRSLSATLFDHWLGLLYLFAVLLVVVGFVAGGAGVTVLRWGLGILGGLLAVHVAVLLLRDTMLARRGAVRTLLYLVAGALIVLGTAWLVRDGLPVAAAWVRSGEPLAWWWPTTLPLRVLSGLLGLSIVLFSAWPLLRRRWRHLPGGFWSPMFAAEFPADGAALAKLSGGVILPPLGSEAPEHERSEREEERRRHRAIPAKVLSGLRVDYGFIAAYWLLFLLFANRLTGTEPRAFGGESPMWLPVALGLGAAVAGTFAALADVAENLRIREAFTTARSIADDALAHRILRAAKWKWALAFVTILLLSPLFLTAAGAHMRVLFAGWVLVGVAGLAGAVRWHRLLEWVFPALGAGLVGAGMFLP